MAITYIQYRDFHDSPVPGRVAIKELGKRLDELESRIERRLSTHDQAIAGLIEAMRELMSPPEPIKKRRIGVVQND